MKTRQRQILENCEVGTGSIDYIKIILKSIGYINAVLIINELICLISLSLFTNLHNLNRTENL
jgi:hypothetical protein